MCLTDYDDSLLGLGVNTFSVGLVDRTGSEAVMTGCEDSMCRIGWEDWL